MSTSTVGSSTHRVNAEALVFHIDLFLAALAATYIVTQIPALLARFSSPDEWRGWHLLRPSRVRPSEPIAFPRQPYLEYEEDASRSEAPTTVTATVSEDGVNSAADLQRRRTHRKLRKEATARQARHVKAWSTRFPRLAAIIRHPLEQGTSVGQAVILLFYFCVLVYATFFKSNIFTDPVRTGYVALSQIPVVLILAARNNPAAMLAGLSYEKLNFVHRLGGKLIVLTVDIHAVGYAYKWMLNDTFDKSIRSPKAAWGIVGFTFTNLLYIFSLPFARRKFHNLFKFIHVFSSFAVVFSLIWHTPRLRRWLLACALIYAFDVLFRLLKTRICTATVIAPTSSSQTIIINIPGLGSGWRAGQHVRIRVLSKGLGGLRWSEAHPLTIAGPPRAPDGSGMTLLLKKAGAWSRGLHNLALAAGNMGYDRESRYTEKMEMEPTKLRVLVEGPYGGLGHTQPSSFSGALIVVGGGGLSFALAVLGDVLLRPRGAGPLSVRLIWAITDAAGCAPFLQTFDALLAGKASGVEVAVVIRYTRAIMDYNMEFVLPAGVVLEPGRPDLRREFDDMARRTLVLNKETRGEGRGLFVAACGPEGMCRDVSTAVNSVDPEVREQLGGVEYLRESFGL